MTEIIIYCCAIIGAISISAVLILGGWLLREAANSRSWIKDQESNDIHPPQR